MNDIGTIVALCVHPSSGNWKGSLPVIAFIGWEEKVDKLWTSVIHLPDVLRAPDKCKFPKVFGIIAFNVCSGEVPRESVCEVCKQNA